VSGGIVGHCGIPPSGERPTSWQTFLRTHRGALAATDFFTTEVWTVRGLVTYYTVFVIELPSRRVSIVGSTAHPDEAFMLQVARLLTDAGDGVLDGRRFLICNRHRRWSAAVRELLETSGVRVIRTPFQARTATRMRNGSCAPSRRNARTTSFSVGERHLRRSCKPAASRPRSTASACRRASQLLLPRGIAQDAALPWREYRALA
jgi:putative transposase